MFTDPALTRQMGSEFLSEWKVCSSFSWKALDSQMLTNCSMVAIEPEEILKHKLLSSGETSVESVISVITYTFDEENGRTTIRARGDFSRPVTDEEYDGAVEGWEAALQSLKEIAEKNNLTKTVFTSNKTFGYSGE